MKPKYSSRTAYCRTPLLASLILVSFSAQAVMAADITMTGDNTVGEVGFSAGTDWPGGTAPAAGNNYFTGGRILRTAADGTSRTFLGDSLRIDAGAGSRFIFKNTASSTTTVANLILNGGSVEMAVSNGDTITTTLAGNINVTGNTTLSALGAAANGSVNFETLNITAPISGSAGLTISGTVNGGTNTGVVRLSAANPYSGTITVASPSAAGNFVASAVNRLLSINHLNALQNATLNLTSVANGVSFVSAISLNGGAYNIGALSGTSNQALTDTASAPVRVSIGGNNTSTTYSGILSGGGSLTKTGTGIQTLSGVNTYTGPTTVSAGILSLGNACLNDTAVVAISSTGTLNLAHAATDVVGALLIDGVAQPAGVYGAIGSGAANPVAAITGTGFLQVVTPPSQNISLVIGDGFGTSSFNTGLHWSNLEAPSAANNYFTGAFLLRTPNAAGAFTFGGNSLTLETGGTMIGKGGGGATVQDLTIGNLILDGGTFYQAETQSDTSILNLHGAVNVTAPSIIGAIGSTANNNPSFETLHVASTISGSANLTIGGTPNNGDNSGVVKLSAANPFSGNLIVTHPTRNKIVASTVNRLLQLNHLDAVANATLTLGTDPTANANVLSFATGVNTGTFNVGALAGTANLPLSDTADLPVALSVGANNASTTYTGALSGTGTLTKVGTGALTLGGPSTLTGTTAVSAGSVILSGVGQSIGDVTTANGTTLGLKLSLAESTIANAANITLGSGGANTLALDFNSLDTFNALASTTGTLRFNGTTTVTISNANFLTAGVHPIIAYSSLVGTVPTGSFPLSPRSTGVLANDTGLQALKLTVTADTPKWTGAGNGNWQVGVTGATKNWKLVTANTPTDYIDTDIVLFDDTAGGTKNVVVSAANVSPLSVTFDTSSSYSLGGAFGITGVTPLVKNGTGTLLITNTNTYTGVTTINDGTLQLGNGTTDGSISSTPAIVNQGTLVYNRVGTFTYGGVISGNGSIVKSGPGVQTLTVKSTYAGSTTVTGGTLANGINDTLPTFTDLTVSGGIYDLAGFDQSIGNLYDGGSGAGTITNSGIAKTLTLNGFADSTYSGLISGALGIRKMGAAALTLPNANLHTGTTFLGGGTLSLGNDGALGTGQLNFAGGNIQSTDSTARTITNPLNFDGADRNNHFIGTGNLKFTATPAGNGTGKIFTVDNPVTEFSGVLGGAGYRTKEGSGILVFSGNNNYSGATTVNAGILRVTNPVLNNTAAVVIAAGATLDLPYSGTDQVGSLTIDGVVQPNGQYGAIGSGAAHPVASITGTGFLQVGVPAVAGFAGFMDGFTNLTTAQKLPTADPDNDGLSNLVEYAIAGADPTVANASPGTFTGGTLSFTKRTLAVTNADISYAIELSTTLGAGSWTVTTPTVDNATTISFTLPTGQQKEFARLRVTQN